MRKRSGALHSQTEEEYLELAQLSQDKTGIFYDDKILNNAGLGRSEGRKAPSTGQQRGAFSDFDFNEEIQECNEEMIEVGSQNQQSHGVITIIIAEKVGLAKRLLSKIQISSQSESAEPVTQGSEEVRHLDLIVGPSTKAKCGIKYWIMDTQFALSPIGSSTPDLKKPISKKPMPFILRLQETRFRRASSVKNQKNDVQNRSILNNQGLKLFQQEQLMMPT